MNGTARARLPVDAAQVLVEIPEYGFPMPLDWVAEIEHMWAFIEWADAECRRLDFEESPSAGDDA